MYLETAWIDSVPEEDLFLSVLGRREIRKGQSSRSACVTCARQESSAWLSNLETTYSERLLPITAAIVDRWGGLSVIQHRLTMRFDCHPPRCISLAVWIFPGGSAMAAVPSRARMERAIDPAVEIYGKYAAVKLPIKDGVQLFCRVTEDGLRSPKAWYSMAARFTRLK